MNLKFYLEKLHASEEYNNFMKENPDAFLCFGFFIIDKENNDNKVHFDFYVSGKVPPQPSIAHSNEFEIGKDSINKNSAEKSGKADFRATTTKRSEDKSNERIFSFQLEDGIKLVPIEVIDTKIPEKILGDCDFNLKEIEKMIEERMKQEGINNKIQKILLSLQSKDGKCFLIGTVFVSSLGLLKVNIDLSENKIVLFKKKSLFDMLKRVK